MDAVAVASDPCLARTRSVYRTHSVVIFGHRPAGLAAVAVAGRAEIGRELARRPGGGGGHGHAAAATAGMQRRWRPSGGGNGGWRPRGGGTGSTIQGWTFKCDSCGRTRPMDSNLYKCSMGSHLYDICGVCIGPLMPAAANRHGKSPDRYDPEVPAESPKRRPRPASSKSPSTARRVHMADDADDDPSQIGGSCDYTENP